MFAIVKTGGKQYKVSQDDVIAVEKLPGKVGETVSLDNVLIVGDEKDVKVGTPHIEGAHVKAKILEQKKDNKIIVFKKKRRQNYRRKTGHRQNITVLKVSAIASTSSAKKATKTKTQATSSSTAKKTSKE